MGHFVFDHNVDALGGAPNGTGGAPVLPSYPTSEHENCCGCLFGLDWLKHAASDCAAFELRDCLYAERIARAQSRQQGAAGF